MNIVTSAAYPTSCINQKTCNQPTSTTDRRGQITDYAYDSTHGGLLTVTGPADASGVHPQTRVIYDDISAHYLTAAGTYSNGTAIWLPVTTSSCRTATSTNAASCVGTADEQVTTTTYPSSGAHNALPIQVEVKAGNNTLNASTALTYDNYSQVKTVHRSQGHGVPG